jgi:hypothetical protein
MQRMTVADLMAALEDFDPNTEVRIMSQQSYPFENAVTGLWEPTANGDDDDEAFVPATGREFGEQPRDGAAPKVVYLVEGRQLGYGTKDAWCR